MSSIFLSASDIGAQIHTAQDIAKIMNTPSDNAGTNDENFENFAKNVSILLGDYCQEAITSGA